MDRGEVTVCVLDADPQLGASIDPEQRQEASAASIAAVETLEKNGRPPESFLARRSGFGLLVLEGLLTRDVSFAGRRRAELLGPGDLLRPWDDEMANASLPLGTRWDVIEPARLAVLDGDFVASAAPWPELAAATSSRILQRARWAGLLLVIGELTPIERRLMVLFWHLADRWGDRTAQGVQIRLPLTHALLAKLIGARRPTVTAALGRLQREGAVTVSSDRSILLHGEPESPSRLSSPAKVAALPLLADQTGMDFMLVALPGLGV